MNFFIILKIFSLAIIFSGQFVEPITVTYQVPSDCNDAGTAAGGVSMYFDSTQLHCLPCPANQVVTSDGLGCMCSPGYRKESSSGSLQCTQCSAGQVGSFSGWDCVSCYESSGAVSTCDTECSLDNGEIPVERMLTGQWYNNQANRRTCTTCAAGTRPDSTGKRCEICSKVPPTGSVSADECDCAPNRLYGGMCFRATVDIVSGQELFKVQFGDSFDSQFFSEHAQAADAQCRAVYRNETACQLLRNLCALSLYREVPSDPTACSRYRDYVSSLTGSAQISGIFYTDPARTVLSDISIPVSYTFPDSALDIVLSSYSLDGRFLGFISARDGVLQLCDNTFGYLNAAYQFGTAFKQECNIPVREFWNFDKYPLVFYEAWLRYSQNSADQIYSVPVLISNYLNVNGRDVNSGTENSQWQLVRRFFLVDNISGRQSIVPGRDPGQSANYPIRYARSMIFHVQLQPNEFNGRILPPWLEIDYAVASTEDYNAASSVKINFQVVYETNEASYRYGMSVALGVLAALAVPYSIVQTWGWLRRSGKMAFDFLSLIKFLLFGCGNLANAFFCVTLGSSLWWLIFYKRQHNVYLLIDEGRNSYFIGFLLSAFFLKAVQLLHVYISQALVDIFLIDWERSPGRATGSVGQKSNAVSIWRTYFVANEWNEIQTLRKISPIFQYFVALLILSVIGVGNIATMDPYSQLSTTDPNRYYAPVSNVLRFAVLGFVYILLAVAQWLFFTFVYERFFEDKISQFVDLCSMCNVSVFILENQMFGYYIHGRSVHGRADTNLKEMHEYFIKERNDLCGKRGLIPDSEQQTFQMAIPRKLRSIYDRIIMPILQARVNRTASKMQASVGGYSAHLDPLTESCIEAHGLLTQALQSFVDHAIRDADYIVKAKPLLQHLLKVEFDNSSEIGSFYIDGGQSFSDILLFGHEMSLVIFEILLISVLDLLTHNYLLDIAITYFIVEIIMRAFRDGMGRSNLARKTLVDKRFLI